MTRDKAKRKAVEAIKVILQAALELREAQEQLDRTYPAKKKKMADT